MTPQEVYLPSWRARRGVTPVRLSVRESNTLVRLDTRGGLTYRDMARVATRLFRRPIAAHTVQQHLKYRAMREERVAWR